MRMREASYEKERQAFWFKRDMPARKAMVVSVRTIRSTTDNSPERKS